MPKLTRRQAGVGIVVALIAVGLLQACGSARTTDTSTPEGAFFAGLRDVGMDVPGDDGTEQDALADAGTVCHSGRSRSDLLLNRWTLKVFGVVETDALIKSALTNICPGTSLPADPTPTVAPAPAWTLAPAAPPQALCPQGGPSPAGAYDGMSGCRPGETVSIARIDDAATFDLADGRHVRLGGVVVNGVGTCAGARALTITQAHVQPGQSVNMVIEPGAGTDPFGNLWVHLQVDAPSYANDLGRVLATAGYAEAYPQGANPTYTQQLQPLVDSARSQPTGQYAPPCATPPPPPPVAAAPAPATTDNTYVPTPDAPGDGYCETCHRAHVPHPHVGRHGFHF